MQQAKTCQYAPQDADSGEILGASLDRDKVGCASCEATSRLSCALHAVCIAGLVA